MWELAPIQLVTSERFEGAQRRTMARWKATGVNITEKMSSTEDINGRAV